MIEQGFVDHVLRLVGFRHVQGNDITLPYQLFQAFLDSALPSGSLVTVS